MAQIVACGVVGDLVVGFYDEVGGGPKGRTDCPLGPVSGRILRHAIGHSVLGIEVVIAKEDGGVGFGEFALFPLIGHDVICAFQIPSEDFFGGLAADFFGAVYLRMGNGAQEIEFPGGILEVCRVDPYVAGDAGIIALVAVVEASIVARQAKSEAPVGIGPESVVVDPAGHRRFVQAGAFLDAAVTNAAGRVELGTVEPADDIGFIGERFADSSEYADAVG